MTWAATGAAGAAARGAAAAAALDPGLDMMAYVSGLLYYEEYLHWISIEKYC